MGAATQPATYLVLARLQPQPGQLRLVTDHPAGRPERCKDNGSVEK
jgi:hypothetical protein